MGSPLRPAGAPRSANRAICRQVAHEKAPFASLRARAGGVPPQEVPARRHSQQPARGRNVESFRSKRPQQPLSARPRQSQVTTENHGVDSSILSLATSFFSCTARCSAALRCPLGALSRARISRDVGPLPTQCRHRRREGRKASHNRFGRCLNVSQLGHIRFERVLPP